MVVSSVYICVCMCRCSYTGEYTEVFWTQLEEYGRLRDIKTTTGYTVHVRLITVRERLLEFYSDLTTRFISMLWLSLSDSE